MRSDGGVNLNPNYPLFGFMHSKGAVVFLLFAVSGCPLQ